MIAEQNKQIILASKHKDEFISNLSHEVRTPLNAIIGYTNLLIQKLDDPYDIDALNHILLSSKNLLHILNDILDLKKIEAGKAELKNISFDLPQTIKNSFETLRIHAQKKGLKYILHIDDLIPTYVKGDPSKLNQVLLNLLGNALKFTSEGKVTLNVKLIECDTKKCRVNFSITDTGIGINKDNLCRIFNSFTQENKSVSTQFGGTGLGLTISQNIIALMGGEINVNSTPNVGTEFSFTIRLEKTKTSIIYEDDITSILIKDIEKIKIIYADDLELNRLLLAKQLKSWNKNLQIKTVKNGKELIEVCKTSNFDIILTDIKMPIMDGIEATKKIREFNKTIPIIGISANAVASDIKSYFDCGMSDYLLKPYEFNELLIKIAKLLNLEFSSVKKQKFNSSKV